MKPLIFIFLISINYTLSDIIDDNSKKIVVKSYPKKVKAGLYQINNSGKYVKKTKATKKQDPDYTVFPNIHNEKLSIPDSPYFPIEKEPDQKRVKKVLPDYPWHSLRSKRSVDKDDDDKKNITRRIGNKIHVRPPRSDPNKLQMKPPKAGKRSMLNQRGKRRQRKGKQNKRIGKRSKHTNLRQNVQKNRNLKYTKKARKTALRDHQAKKALNDHRALRSKLGEKQANKLIQSRQHFMNKSKNLKGARRLIAARDAMIEVYPYVVSIQKDKQHWCAGALLNPRMVITTANCLWKANRMSHMKVRAGSRHTDRGGQVARIQEVMKHPGWKIRKNPDNDVALILLDRNIKFSDTCHGVDLPNRVMMPAFEDAWITSWGAERRDGVYETKSNTLQVYHARLMNRVKCNNVTQRFGVTVSDNFICLAQTGKRAPCTRDTGAPAVSDGVLWGLASWGIRKLCGTERFPAMFSYLGSQTNLDFVINATHFLMADERFYPFPDRAPIVRAQTTTPTDMTLPL